MDFRRANAAVLVDFTRNVVGRLSGHEIECLPDDVADTLAAELQQLNDAFESDIARSIELETLLRSVYASRKRRQPQIVSKLSNVLKHLTAKRATDADLELCGFKTRKTWTRVIAQDPGDLVVTGSETGVNKLRFKGNNRRNSVRYEVYRRKSPADEWTFLGLTPQQSFVDKPVVPGQFYEYKVRALASTTTSNFSDSAVVYADS